MSYEYDRYLAQHKSNVEAGFRWLQKNLPEITEGSGAEHNIVFAHDQSKTEPDEYGPYDIYFYGGNRSYAVVEDFQPCVERLYAGGEIAEQFVYCEHRERCSNIYDFIHEKIEKEKL